MRLIELKRMNNVDDNGKSNELVWIEMWVD